MTKDNQHISLQEPELPEILRNARRNHGGDKVPDGFFEQFEQKMNAMIDAEQQAAAQTPTVQRPEAKQKSNRWLRVAAMLVFVVAVGISWQFYRMSGTVDQQVQQAMTLAESQDEEMPESEESLPEQVEEEFLTATSDYDI